MNPVNRRRHYPDEHIYKGILYHRNHPNHHLKDVEESLNLTRSHVVIASYPKSGNTWMSEILYQIRHGDKATNSAYRSSKAVLNMYPFLEFRKPGAESNVQKIKNDPNIRGVRTHLRPSFFERMLSDPETCPKFIVVVRNPKDSLVSYHHFERSIPFINMDETFEEFFERYRDNGVVFGNNTDHIADWWRYKQHPCVHIVFYEDLLDDFKGNIRQLAKFLECPLSEEDEERVYRASRLEVMKSRGITDYIEITMDESVQPFFRKATKGDWRTMFSSAHREYVDQQIKEKLHPLGLYLDLDL